MNSVTEPDDVAENDNHLSPWWITKELLDHSWLAFVLYGLFVPITIGIHKSLDYIKTYDFHYRVLTAMDHYLLILGTSVFAFYMLYVTFCAHKKVLAAFKAAVKDSASRS